MRSRLLPLLALTAVSAIATYGARQWLATPRPRRATPARREVDTWEYEGGNLHPRETRSLQQQLG
jgi:hypothetical protein